MEELLIKNNETQTNLSRKTGILQSTISNIINGKTLKIKKDNMIKIANFFDESLADIQKINLDYIKKIKNINDKD